MTLSVSVFPEPSRHTGVYRGGRVREIDTHEQPSVAWSLWSNNNGGNQKPHPTTTSKPDEYEIPSTTPPPTTPGLLILSQLLIRTTFSVGIRTRIPALLLKMPSTPFVTTQNFPFSCPFRIQYYTVRYQGIVEVSNDTTALVIVVTS